MVQPIRLEPPRRIWASDGHVLIELVDGRQLILTPETALALSRMLASAGTDSLINRVMDGEI